MKTKGVEQTEEERGEKRGIKSSLGSCKLLNQLAVQLLVLVTMDFYL